MWKKAISLLMLLKLEMCLKEPHKAQELKKRFKMSRKKKEKKKNTICLTTYIHMHMYSGLSPELIIHLMYM